MRSLIFDIVTKRVRQVWWRLNLIVKARFFQNHSRVTFVTPSDVCQKKINLIWADFD